MRRRQYVRLLLWIALFCCALALFVVLHYLKPKNLPSPEMPPLYAATTTTVRTVPALPLAPASPPALPSGLSDVERSTIAIYRRASPGVVSVANRALVQDYFGLHVYEIPQGVGSGVVWDKAGHILSNFHVIYQASSIMVTLRNGTSYNAEIVGVDPDHDLAVLKIKAPAAALEPLVIGTSHDLEVGQTVLAIGNPFGLDTSLSIGIVSALGRSMETLSRRRVYDVIQTDAAINPGNSGGPLLDSSGRMIGINTAILSPSGAYAGVGFAVPVDTVRRIVPQLITEGKVTRAGLGIHLVPDRILRRYDIPGVAIMQVTPQSAAAAAGLRGLRSSRGDEIRFGDIITAVDDRPVKDSDDYFAAMDRHRGGDLVRVTYLRDGKSATVDVTLQRLED